MRGFGCSVSRLLILHIIKGKAPGCQYMTDWDRINLVLCSRLHRSDRLGDRPRTFKPKRLKVGTWKTNEVKVQGRPTDQKPTFNQLLNKYTKAGQKDRPLKKRSRSPPRQDHPASPRRESSRCRGGVFTLYPPQKMYATMPWVPPASNATNP